MSEGLLLQRSTEAELICQGQMVSFTRAGDPNRGDLMKEVMVRGCKKPVGLHHILCKTVLSETGEHLNGSSFMTLGFVQCLGSSREDGSVFWHQKMPEFHIKTSCSVLYINSLGVLDFFKQLFFFFFCYHKFWCL